MPSDKEVTEYTKDNLRCIENPRQAAKGYEVRQTEEENYYSQQHEFDL
ncbi:MAG: hypothetical protein OEW23_02920 [Candidatus Aminicenantes bacterium]|nr:hypothetical protein [Candidatus Aminicenantes bacterium]